METKPGGTKIPMQIGSELRIKKDGQLVLDNPELELSDQSMAADAVLSYTYNRQTGEHVIRLLSPVSRPESGVPSEE
jgi:hypothetical protein